MSTTVPVESTTPPPPESPSESPSRRPARARRLAGVHRSEIRDLLAVVDTPGILSLAGGLPAPDALPRARLETALARVLDHDGRNGPVALQYGPTEGIGRLRALVAPGTPGSPRLGRAERVLVTTGSQQAIELVVRALVDPGDPVVVEDPLYLGTRQVLDGYGARVVPIPVDASGLDTDRLATALAHGLRPKLVIVVPNHSNPSGATLPSDRRAHLGELASRDGFVIVEDDPYHGLAFHGRPAAPIGAHAPDHTVVVGSASKMIAPGLRVGFLGAPEWLYPSLVALKQSLDLHTPTLNQLLVADVLEDPGFLTAHLRAVAIRSAERANTLIAALDGVVRCAPATGGMFLWGRTTVDTRAALGAAIRAGVAYVPGDAFTVAADGRRALRLSFATLAPADLIIAADRLREGLSH